MVRDNLNREVLAMECRKRLTPGMNGTKRYLNRFGDRLLYVRYRVDPVQKRRVTTVELIVDEGPMSVPRNAVEKAMFPFSAAWWVNNNIT